MTGQKTTPVVFDPVLRTGRAIQGVALTDGGA